VFALAQMSDQNRIELARIRIEFALN